MQASIANIVLGNKANIRNISEIHNEIYSVFTTANGVALDTAACTEADLSLVQLIESARLYARASGKTFRLAAPPGPAVEAVLRRAGFLEKAAEEDRRFWFNEGVE